MRKGISLVGIKTTEEILRITEEFPSVSFELSYAMDSAFLEAAAPYIEGRTVSVHSLSPRREFFPNFASDDPSVIEWSEREMLCDAATAQRFGASVLVLHPGYLIPSLVPSDSTGRIKMMEAMKPFIGIEKGAICRQEYNKMKEYRAAFETMIPNLVRLSGKLAGMGLTLAVENLNPRAGYMLMLPCEIEELAERTPLHFTLDIGHLWMSAELFGFDFLDGVKRVLATGRVVTTHLHSNPSSKEKGIFADTHQSLDRYCMPYREVLSAIERSGANMILETVEDAGHNLSLLFS